jgi:hypothetical protein
VRVDPVDGRRHVRGNAGAERRQRILDPRRHDGVTPAHQKTVTLELAQRLREHLLRYALDTRPKFREAKRTRGSEPRKHEAAPAPGDVAQNGPSRTRFVEAISSKRRLDFRFVLHDHKLTFW